MNASVKPSFKEEKYVDTPYLMRAVEALPNNSITMKKYRKQQRLKSQETPQKAPKRSSELRLPLVAYNNQSEIHQISSFHLDTNISPIKVTGGQSTQTRGQQVEVYDFSNYTHLNEERSPTPLINDAELSPQACDSPFFPKRARPSPVVSTPKKKSQSTATLTNSEVPLAQTMQDNFKKLTSSSTINKSQLDPYTQSPDNKKNKFNIVGTCDRSDPFRIFVPLNSELDRMNEPIKRLPQWADLRISKKLHFLQERQMLEKKNSLQTLLSTPKASAVENSNTQLFNKELENVCKYYYLDRKKNTKDLIKDSLQKEFSITRDSLEACKDASLNRINKNYESFLSTGGLQSKPSKPFFLSPQTNKTSMQSFRRSSLKFLPLGNYWEQGIQTKSTETTEKKCIPIRASSNFRLNTFQRNEITAFDAD